MATMKNKSFSHMEVAKSVRKTWGELNPTTRVVESKRKFSRKEKFQKRFED